MASDSPGPPVVNESSTRVRGSQPDGEISGGEAVVKSLELLGVEYVFGIVSVHNLPIFEALDRSSITVIQSRHEQGAVHAADGYARASGRIGVAIASTGPGTANAVPGLYEALFSSSPVLLITGQVETRFLGKGKGLLHEAEQQAPMLRAVTRRVDTVRFAGEIGEVTAKAVTFALSGRRGPVAVEIPIDLQYQKLQEDPPLLAPKLLNVAPQSEQLDAAASELAASRRPLIWAGGGVISADASAALVILAERIGAPVITTVEGRGAIPENHPLALGCQIDEPEIQHILDEADLLLAVGTRFPPSPFDRWSTPPGRLVHIDIDPRMIGLNHPPTVGVVADARLALESLARVVDESAPDPDFVSEAKAAASNARQRALEGIGADHRSIMDTIRRSLPRHAPIVRDCTIPAYAWGDKLLPILEPRTSIRPNAAGIGPGLPLAIGAACATKTTHTVLIQGDGGIMLSIGELATAVENDLPLIVCLFVDNGYGVLRMIEEFRFGGRTFAVDLHTPDFEQLGRSMGMRATRVEHPDAFETALHSALEFDGPTLIVIDQSRLAAMPGW
jgi:acetolactate synthase-1/2/3 large subunit